MQRAFQEAWAASDYEVQDCIDYEVYKMIGRHGADMVTRGIMPTAELFAIGFTREPLTIFFVLPCFPS